MASAGGPYLLDEGGPAVALDSSLSADSDGTIASYAWSPTTGLDNPASATPNLTPPNDNTTYDITLTVTDDDALVDSDTATVTVQNVPPVITGVTLPATANEGSPVNLQVTFTDQGTDDTHVAFINWGDNSGHSDAATSPLALQHTYTAPGNYTVDVCIQDDDLGQVCTDPQHHDHQRQRPAPDHPDRDPLPRLGRGLGLRRTTTSPTPTAPIRSPTPGACRPVRPPRSATRRTRSRRCTRPTTHRST